MFEKQLSGQEMLTPLSDQEIDQLEAALEEIPEGLFDTSMLHGLLSCAAVAPTAIQLPWLYDSVFKPPGSPGFVFKEQAHVEAILGLVMRLQNQIIMELDTDLFEPWVFFENSQGQTIVVLQPWCSGFLHGTSFDVEAWSPLFEQRPHLVAPILRGAEIGEIQSPPLDEETGIELSVLIEEAVPNIRGFFRKQGRWEGS